MATQVIELSLKPRTYCNFLFFKDLINVKFFISIKKVPPTRMNLTMFKQKQVAAKKGYDLLKKKSDALKVIFNRFK